MRHTRPLISNLKKAMALLLWPLLFSACVEEPISTKNADRLVTKNTYQKIYFSSYDSVWRAAQLALHYPIAINNMDNGVLETDWIRAVDGFTPPTAAKPPSQGVRYKIQLNLVKGRIDHRESVRVTIVKKIEKQRDFFSDPENQETDGLEEKVLFYRIERELIIEDALKKASKQG